MNFNVYINDELANQLAHLAKTEGKSRNALIRDALDFYLKSHTDQHWPNDVLNFSGINQDFQPFETHRAEFKPALDRDIF